MKRKSNGTAGIVVKRTRAIRDKNAPKPPKSAYMHFICQQSKAVGNIKHLAGIWTGMDEEQRKPYVEKAAISRMEYEKEMESYKNSEDYKQFQSKKSTSKKSREDDKELGLNGIQIFSKEFLDYNKSRESSLRKLRKEIGDLEEETEDIEKQIASLAKELDMAQGVLHADESQRDGINKLLEKWRRQTIRAMDESRLLAHFRLNTQSNTEDLVAQLEEAAKKHDSHANTLRTCLSAINF